MSVARVRAGAIFSIIGVVAAAVSLRPPVAPAQTTAVSTTILSTSAASTPSLTWRSCPTGAGLDCATLRVPLDHVRPAGPTITLALARLPARRPSQRIGVLFVNPGGPGGSGIGLLRRAQRAFGGRLRDRFDIVSWDPRGVAASTPVRCTRDKGELERFILLDPDPEGSAEEQQVVESVTRFAKGCETISGAALLAHVDTVSTVRDLDAIRAAMRVEQISYLGFSYGTLIGAVYADLFPTRVRAMVLDGALDPSLGTIERLRGQAAGFQEAIELWAKDCVGRASCRRRIGPDPAARVDALMRDLETTPLRVGKRQLDGTAALYGVIAAMYSPRSGWERLREAVADALDGNGALLLAIADGYFDRNPDGSFSNTIESNLAVSCADEATSPDVDVWRRLGDELAVMSPVFGRAIGWSGLACGRWPAPSKNIVGPRRAVGAPPIVVIGTTRDPATPVAWSRSLAAQLDSGVFVENEATGHTAYFSGGACIRRVVEDGLLGPSIPVDGTRCR
jgi:pimeloyl-ACP methyl ester carboxylesterase